MVRSLEKSFKEMFSHSSNPNLSMLTVSPVLLSLCDLTLCGGALRWSKGHKSPSDNPSILNIYFTTSHIMRDLLNSARDLLD